MRTKLSLFGNYTDVEYPDRRSGRTVLITVVAIPLAALTGLIGCGTTTNQSATKDAMPSPAAAPATTRKEPAPPALANIGELGENLYDAAKARKWPEARTKFNGLKAAMQNSNATLGKSGEQRNKLQGLVASLDTSIGKKAEFTTMRDANQVTLIVSELMASYETNVPVDINRLDYDGRELEIWARTHVPQS